MTNRYLNPQALAMARGAMKLAVEETAHEVVVKVCERAGMDGTPLEDIEARRELAKIIGEPMLSAPGEYRGLTYG